MSDKANRNTTNEPRKTTTEASEIELDESELDQVGGGADLRSSKLSSLRSWKMASFDGKGNDVLSEEL